MCNMSVELIDFMGTDLTPVNAARVSMNKASDWEIENIVTEVDADSRVYHEYPILKLKDKDAKLISYLASNGHTSCFEHQVASFRLKVPIFVARQVQRHRTFCLAGDNEISFSRPSDGRHYPYRLDRLYKNWSDPAQRARLKGMRIRSVDETTNTIFNNSLEDVVYSGKKPVYTLLLDNGAEVTASEDHRILTSEGWLTVRDLREAPVPVMAANAHLVRNIDSVWPENITSTEWRWIPGWEGRYEVSDAGEVRSHINTRGSLLKIPQVKRRTKNTAGYACVSLSTNSLSRMYNCHALVMEAFVGPRPEGQEIRHLDGNRLNSALSNLAYGFPYENQEDRKDHGTVKYLGTAYYDILEIVFRGIEDTYDIAVDGPHHNFFAGGIVVHNSYNEVSRRYVKDDLEFYWPDKWRKAAANVKQGSSDEAADDQRQINYHAQNACHGALLAYKDMLAQDVAPELARMILPQNLMTTFYMTGSLRNWAHFLKLRLDSHAQQEVREVAQMINDVLVELWPISMKELMK